MVLRASFDFAMIALVWGGRQAGRSRVDRNDSTSGTERGGRIRRDANSPDVSVIVRSAVGPTVTGATLARGAFVAREPLRKRACRAESLQVHSRRPAQRQGAALL